MRILLICQRTDGTDGWSTYTKLLREELIKRGHEVHTISSAKGDGNAVLHAPLSYLSKPWRSMFDARLLGRFIRDLQLDILHITVEPYATMVPFLEKSIQAKTVLTIHGSYGVRPLKQNLSRLLARRYYRSIKAFITVSEYTKMAVEKALQHYASKEAAHTFRQHATVIRNGIQLPNNPLSTPNNSTKIVLLVGEVKRRKGIVEAIDACAAYKQLSSTPFRFRILGSYAEGDPYMQTARDRVRVHGMTDQVTFEGRVSHEVLTQAYREADLYLMPANTDEDSFEGYGLSYIEANAYGVPCIGPTTSGAAEAILEGKSGYHIESADAMAIAKRMQSILDKGSISRQECREWAEQHAIGRAVENIEKAYQATLER